jgi:hypothetical protein
MSWSQHSKWMTVVDGKQRIFRQEHNRYDVLEFERYPYTPDQVDKLSKSIRSNLADELICKEIREKYPDNNLRWKQPLLGCSFLATFVLLYLMDTKVLEPMISEVLDGKAHWWLRDNLSQERYDLFSDQFPNNKELKNVYRKGKTRGYYGFVEMPNSLVFDLIQKVQPNSKRWNTNNYSETPSTLDEFLTGRPHESLF